MRACVRACVLAFVRLCVFLCVRLCVCAFVRLCRCFAPFPSSAVSWFSTRAAAARRLIFRSPSSLGALPSEVSTERGGRGVGVAAKEVNTIDTYAESQNINKLDLVIVWVWFYFFTKPLFFVIRSEVRRVWYVCRSRLSPYHYQIDARVDCSVVLLTP